MKYWLVTIEAETQSPRPFKENHVAKGSISEVVKKFKAYDGIAVCFLHKITKEDYDSMDGEF